MFNILIMIMFYYSDKNKYCNSVVYFRFESWGSYLLFEFGTSDTKDGHSILVVYR